MPTSCCLQLLPVPSRLDFSTSLPVLSGKSIILTLVDQFSKLIHLLALPKRPSSLETAQLLVCHVHDLPVDIVSDCGPTFLSCVWTTFCKALRAMASLSSGYHPQTNGQTERWTKTWRQPSAVHVFSNRRPGPAICRRSDMPTTPWACLPQAGPRLWLCTVSNPPCSLPRKVKWTTPPFSSTWSRPIVSGEKPEQPYHASPLVMSLKMCRILRPHDRFTPFLDTFFSSSWNIKWPNFLYLFAVDCHYKCLFI